MNRLTHLMMVCVVVAFGVFLVSCAESVTQGTSVVGTKAKVESLRMDLMGLG